MLPQFLARFVQYQQFEITTKKMIAVIMILNKEFQNWKDFQKLININFV